MTEWFKDESFWREMYPFIFSEERFDDAEMEVEGALALVDFRGEAVLDLCCGPGRHAIALARRGLTVTGVDSTPFLLQKAKAAAQAEKLDIEWILEDMRAFVRPQAFDLVVNMLTSFGYFERKEDDLTILENIRRSLRPGGACVFDMVGKELIARTLQTTLSYDLPGGNVLIKRLDIEDEWTRLKNEWLLIKDGSVRTFTFHQTIYSGQELKDRLLQAGFSGVRLYGDLNGREYGLHGSRLVAVART